MSDPAGIIEKDIRMKEAEAKRVEEIIKKQLDLKMEDISPKTTSAPASDAKPNEIAIEKLTKEVEQLKKDKLLLQLTSEEQEQFKDVTVDVLTGIIAYKNSLDPEKQKELLKKKKEAPALERFPETTDEVPGKDKGKKKSTIPGNIGGYNDDTKEWDAD